MPLTAVAAHAMVKLVKGGAAPFNLGDDMDMRLLGRRLLAGVTLACAVATLTACAEGARPANMAIESSPAFQVSQADPQYKTYRVGHVQGGGKTNPLWASSVSADDFQKALEASLRAMGFLADDPAGAKTEITADLKELNRPLAGLDLTVTSTVHYTAKATTDQKVVFDDTVAASGTAKFGEALIAVQRLQLANEAAMRENIKAFIERLREATGATKTASN